MLPTLISASILSADFAHLADDIHRAIDAGISHIHFDVMDHHYVPNLTFGADICRSLRAAGITIPIDVHLMVEKPEQYIEPFAKAGANWITFHPSTTANVEQTLNLILENNMQPGLAFNPDEKIQIDPQFLKVLRTILVMSVFPGFGGQSFIDDSLTLIKNARRLIDEYNPDIYLGVDGGINPKTVGKAAKAGANFFVVGSALFKSDDYKKTVNSLKEHFNE